MFHSLSKIVHCNIIVSNELILVDSATFAIFAASIKKKVLSHDEESNQVCTAERIRTGSSLWGVDVAGVRTNGQGSPLGREDRRRSLLYGVSG